jgi:restriction endonuclease Mrr
MGAIIVSAAQLRSMIGDALSGAIDRQATEEDVDAFLAANPDLHFANAQYLSAPDSFRTGNDFALRVRSEVWEDFQNEVEETIHQQAGQYDESDDDDLGLATDGLTPVDQRLWVPSDQEPKPQWIDTSPSAILIARELIEEGRLLSEMDWREFEKLIAELLEKDGWKIQLLRGTKDGGIDVISSRTDPAIGALKAIWQAKRYGEGHKVQLAHARELSGVVQREAASKGVLVTTTSLTRGALDWVKQDEFRLSAKDGNEVRKWIEKHS